MNIHHLELFYYVARHGGITGAVRHIPYGIQQLPPSAGRLAGWREFLGVTALTFTGGLFSLTPPPGEQLYRFVEPFFTGIDAVTSELPGRRSPHQIRIGSSRIKSCATTCPNWLGAVRRKRQFPGLKVSLREALPTRTRKHAGPAGNPDVAITLMERKLPGGVHSLATLLELPLILVVPAESPPTGRRSFELWKRGQDHRAAHLSAGQLKRSLKNFQQGLGRLGVEWLPGIEINSVDAIESYVAHGFGIGLSVSIPKTRMSPKVRALPLPGFPNLIMGALWRGPACPAVGETFGRITGARPAVARLKPWHSGRPGWWKWRRSCCVRSVSSDLRLYGIAIF